MPSLEEVAAARAEQAAMRDLQKKSRGGIGIEPPAWSKSSRCTKAVSRMPMEQWRSCLHRARLTCLAMGPRTDATDHRRGCSRSIGP